MRDRFLDRRLGEQQESPRDREGGAARQALYKKGDVIGNRYGKGHGKDTSSAAGSSVRWF